MSISKWHSQRRTVFAVVLAVVPSLCAFLFALARNHVQGTGEFEIDGLYSPRRMIDIGTVWSGGDRVVREFSLQNRGQQAVYIRSVESDCGCTTAHALVQVLSPGQSARIPVVFVPPAIANDLGGTFRRTIKVNVASSRGENSISFFLTGFIAPDEALRIFPVNVSLQRSYGGAARTVLHLKGAADLISSIPDHLSIEPGVNQRVVVHWPAIGHVHDILSKDVEIQVSRFPAVDGESIITFAPDLASDGLKIRINAQSPPLYVSIPQSILLSDDDNGRSAIVAIRANSTGVPVVDATDTGLPLLCHVVTPADVRGATELRIELAGHLTRDISGTLRVHLHSSGEPGGTLLIPVIALTEFQQQTHR